MDYNGVLWGYTEDNGDELLTINMEVSINGGTPIAGWFMREHPSINDWGVPLFQETSMLSLDESI